VIFGNLAPDTENWWLRQIQAQKEDIDYKKDIFMRTFDVYCGDFMLYIRYGLKIIQIW